MATKPKNKKKRTLKSGKVTIVSDMRDYGNEPFFVEKAEKSRQFLEKHGFPDFPVKK